MSTTRLLLLGVLLDKPLHGYEVRKTLETWSADQWANVAYGSIYFGLAKMAEEGLLEVVDGQPAGRGRGRAARTVYALTDEGRGEFERLLRVHWWQPKGRNDPFLVALTFMDRLPKEELLAALRRRAALLRADVEGLELAGRLKVQYGAVRHIRDIHELGAERCRAELGWIDRVIAKVERDELP